MTEAQLVEATYLTAGLICVVIIIGGFGLWNIFRD
jgi:hypothetical protein